MTNTKTKPAIKRPGGKTRMLKKVEREGLTLAKTTAAAWPAGTAAYPLLFGRLTDLPRFRLQADELGSARIQFEELLS